MELKMFFDWFVKKIEISVQDISAIILVVFIIGVGIGQI